MMSDQPSLVVRLPLGIIKFAVIWIGFILTLLALMAIIGHFSANGWVRIIGALVVGIGLPLFLVEKILPDDPSTRPGLATDYFALIYGGITLAYFILASSFTQKWTIDEAERLASAGYRRIANGAFYLANAKPAITGAKAIKGSPKKIASSAKEKSNKKNTPTHKKPAQKPNQNTILSAQELFERYSPAVVSVHKAGGMGTGVLIDDKGTIITNYHVAGHSTGLKVKLKNGDWVKEIDILDEDKKRDVVLLRVKANKLPNHAYLGNSDTIKVGEPVVSIGNPLGLSHTLTNGLVSSRRIYEGQKWVQMSAPVSPGNSGGPLFNMRGEVIGITTAQVGGMWNRAQNLNLAIPINDVKKMIKDKYPNRKKAGSGDTGTW